MEVDVTMELRDTVQQLFDMTTRKDFNSELHALCRMSRWHVPWVSQ